jgi:hypothetical protein
MPRRWLLVVSLAVAVLAAPASALALQPAASSHFQSAQGCYCHGFLFYTWSQSMHAKALSDPLYQRKVEQADVATHGKLSGFCNECHGPVASMSGEIHGLDTSKASAVSKEAVTCDFCHQVTALGAPLSNTSQVLTPDGTKRAQLADSKSPAHKTASSPIYASAEFCGSCHDVSHPVNGMHLETAYSEWKASPYAKQGIVCQECHMDPQPGTAGAGGKQRDKIYMMSFAGGNAGIGSKSAAEQMLRSAARIDVQAPDQTGGGDDNVTVTVRNVGAGHFLPTGLTEVRKMWLEVRFVDGTGAVIATKRHDYGTVLKDAKGNHPVELWDAAGVYSDDRIPPQGASTLAFPLPKTSGPVSVVASLLYRSASEDFASSAHVTLPTTLMASARQDIAAAPGYVSQPAPSATVSGPNPFVAGATCIGLLAVMAGMLGLLVTRSRKARRSA